MNIESVTKRLSVCAAVAITALAGCGQQAPFGPVPNPTASLAIRETLTASATTAEAGPAAASTGTGWATLRGTFTYKGEPPKREPYNVNKDEAVCKMNGQAPLQELLVVDPSNNGIKDVAIYVRNASRVHESAQAKAGEVVFDQQHCVFSSHVFPVIVGQTVLIKNSDPVGHNTKIAGAKTQFNQTIPDHNSIPFVPQKEEATPAAVACSIHPWMSAYMLPRANGYFAVTGPDGKFEIANLPAGEPLEIQVWHESATGPGNTLVVGTPEAKALKWNSKGRFTVTLQPDEVKEIPIDVPSSAFRG